MASAKMFSPQQLIILGGILKMYLQAHQENKESSKPKVKRKREHREAESQSWHVLQGHLPNPGVLELHLLALKVIWDHLE